MAAGEVALATAADQVGAWSVGNGEDVIQQQSFLAPVVEAKEGERCRA